MRETARRGRRSGPRSLKSGYSEDKHERTSARRGAPTRALTMSIDAFWSRGAPTASLSPRYWPLSASHEGPDAAACSPQTNAQYTGFHGEGGAFCHGGIAGDVDAGNVLHLSLRSPSGTLDLSMLPTGFPSGEMVLNGQPLASTLLIRAISRAGTVLRLVAAAAASSRRGEHRIKTVRRGHIATHLLVTDVAWSRDAGMTTTHDAAAPTRDGCFLELTAWAD